MVLGAKANGKSISLSIPWLVPVKKGAQACQLGCITMYWSVTQGSRTSLQKYIVYRGVSISDTWYRNQSNRKKNASIM